MFEIKIDNEKIVREYAKSTQKRVQLAIDLIPAFSVEYLRKQIGKYIPRETMNDVYGGGLSNARVSGMDFGTASSSVYMKNVQSQKKKSTSTSIVFVYAKNTMQSQNKGIQILQKNNPWTLETMPFVPSKNEAVLVYRNVTPRDFNSIEKKHKNTEREIRMELESVGVTRNDKIKIAPRSIISDKALAAIQLETGSGGRNASPHWRPAIRDLLGTGIKDIVDKKILNILLNMRYNNLNMPSILNKRISRDTAKSFIYFQDRLAIAIS